MEFPTPAEFLSRLGELVSEFNLLRSLKKHETLYRVRQEENSQCFDRFQDLGPPPDEKATAGQMNPAGIAYLLSCEGTENHSGRSGG